jgi:hypothetical protein
VIGRNSRGRGSWLQYCLQDSIFPFNMSILDSSANYLCGAGLGNPSEVLGTSKNCSRIICAFRRRATSAQGFGPFIEERAVCL